MQSNAGDLCELLPQSVAQRSAALFDLVQSDLERVVDGDADVEPGVTPVSEVRGTRQEGPGNPLPPTAGNAQISEPDASSNTMLFLLLGAFGLMAPGMGMLAVAYRNRRER